MKYRYLTTRHMYDELSDTITLLSDYRNSGRITYYTILSRFSSVSYYTSGPIFYPGKNGTNKYEV